MVTLNRFILAAFGVLILFISGCNLPQGTSVPTQDISVDTEVTPLPEEQMQYLPSIAKEPESDGGFESYLPLASNEPHLEIIASRRTIKVGETITITGKPVNIDLPYYYLIIRDEGIQNNPPTAQVTYDNQLFELDGASLILELQSADGQIDQVIFKLRAKEVGVTTITINVTGDVQDLGDDSFHGKGAGSGSIVISVIE